MVAKVSVSSHVVVEIIKSGKMYDESIDVQTVIKSTMGQCRPAGARPRLRADHVQLPVRT